MFKLNKLLVVAAFALTSALGQNAFAENTGVTNVNPTEATITVLNEQAAPEIPAIDDVLETDGEFTIVEDAIIGEELSADDLQGLITNARVCTSKGCVALTPRCPACKINVGRNPRRRGQCKKNRKVFVCFAARRGTES